MKVKKVYLEPLMSVEQSDLFEGKMLSFSDVKIMFKDSVDVYCKQTKQCIAKYRKNVIPADIQLAAFTSLKKVVGDNSNRAVTSATSQEAEITKKGKASKTSRVRFKGEVLTGIAGFFDRTPRFPNCRLTAFNKHHFDKFKKAYPIIKLVDNMYKSLMPEQYSRQRKQADKTSKDFVIPDTSFTTVTVNQNWQTAVHKDSGDFKEGFGNLVALRKGTFTGGYFVVVRWGVGFDLRNGDLLMVDVHQWHGNTPIVKDDKNAIRLSLVMYYRENMINCGTMAEELKRVQNRKKGESLNG
jgi:hypothetical protein